MKNLTYKRLPNTGRYSRAPSIALNKSLKFNMQSVADFFHYGPMCLNAALVFESINTIIE